MKKTQFEKYVDLIRKRAHEYSEKYNIDYSEMESQGFLIYCECLEKYDPDKAKFTTYLYIQLNRLNDFAKTYKRQKGLYLQDYFNPEHEVEDYEERMISKDYNSPQIIDFLTEAKKELSEEAFKLIVWIVKREWEGKNRRIPTISMAMKYFNKTRQKIQELWNECGNFWLNQGLEFYA
jgi:hypothetical protein